MFLYYIPNLTHATVCRQSLVDAGLADVFRDALAGERQFQSLQVRNIHHNGPDAGSGVIVAFPATDDFQIGYYPATQGWHWHGGYWLGFYSGQAITPAALKRDAGFTAGEEVELGDGQVWTVPTIRRVGRYPAIPRGMGLDKDTGEFTMTVLPAYDFAWQASGEIFDHVFGSQVVDWGEAFRLCCVALSLNYRVGPAEASAMGLITTDNFESIFSAVIDLEKIKKLLGEPGGEMVPDDQKKRELTPANASISHGPPEG